MQDYHKLIKTFSALSKGCNLHLNLISKTDKSTNTPQGTTWNTLREILNSFFLINYPYYTKPLTQMVFTYDSITPFTNKVENSLRLFRILKQQNNYYSMIKTMRRDF